MPDDIRNPNPKYAAAEVRGATGEYKPDYWQNLKEGLGFAGSESQRPRAADPTQAGAGLMGPDRKTAEDALARKLQRINGGS